ncbi:hypothetical protein GCM10022291_20320 [Postechiella marina]|uniref:Uncharacterized protein n=1 Tax=Postechiella marina TaxID=943941 RepID=A0ABP8C9Y9_9FLAO
MNDLNYIISTLSQENKQRFVIFLEKKNKRKDIKNIQLFKLLAKNELNSTSICKTLYGNNKKDAYHGLRKRLYDALIDFTANISLQEENTVNMSIIKYLLAARTFLELKNHKAAYKILAKAEKLALEHHLYPYLNEIYSTQIQYAHANPSININDVILKFKKNKLLHQQEDNLNIVYTKIRQTLNNINFKSEITDFETLFKNTLKDYNITLQENLSFKSLYQLIAIVSLSAFVTKDYLKIESFLINAYKKRLHDDSTDSQTYYHIQILYLIANTLFRNKKFEESLRYLKLMHNQMQDQQKKHFYTFKLKYHLLLGLNLNYTNKQKQAIELLVPIVNKKHVDIESLLDIHLSLSMFYFQKNDFNNTLKLLSQLNHSDKWYSEKAGKAWVIKKNLMEILLHIELKNIDLVDSRILSFKRSFSKYLKAINQQRVLTFLTLVETYYKKPEKIITPTFKNTVDTSFEWIHPDQEDIFVMSFYAWLKSKIEKQHIFKTTLELIHKYNYQN